VKIPPAPDNVRFLPSGADRDPAGSFYDQGQGGSGKKRRPQNPYASEEAAASAPIEVTDEVVNAAMATFQADQQTKAQGIAAEVQGTGPGLRVVLKDGAGTTIRNLSGEEFLRLREATNAVRVSGKILDQKA
jgi:pyruvate/2-oxoglutarate dehydrogenase complex dihydrolipoamide acyltransferase (E2) component